MRTTISAKRKDYREGRLGTIVAMILAGAILVVNFGLAIRGIEGDPLIEISAVIGQVVFAPLVFCAIFMIGKKYRTFKNAAIIFFCISLVLSVTLIGDLAKKQDSPEEYLAKVVNEANQGLPKMLDAETEIVSVEGMGKTLVTTYRVVSYDLDEMNVDVFHDQAMNHFVERICTNRKMKRNFFARGLDFRYRYMDQNGNLITDIDITPSVCEKSGSAE